MTEWRALKMADVIAEFYDGPHATPPPADEGPVYLGIKNITDAGLLDLTEVRHIAEADFARWTKRVTPRPGDIVFTYEATLHRYALIPQGFRGCLGRRLALIRPDPAVVHPRFLHFAMLGPAWRSTVTERIISGSTVDRIPILTFPDFPIELPDLDVQERVASVLGAIDDLIENSRRRVELLEDMARAIYREWFVRFRYPAHQELPLVDSTLGPIPDGWSVAALGDIAELVRANVQPSRYPDEPFDHFSIPAFDDGRLPVVEPGEVIRSGKYLLDAPAVMISKLNPRIERTWFAAPGTERRSVTSTEFLILRPRERSTLVHLYLLARSDLFQEKLRELSGGTSTSHQRAKPADFLGLKVLCPPVQLVRELTDRVENAIAMTDVLRRENRVLSGLRDLLLPRLVSGAIDVSDLDLELAGASA